MGTEAFIFQDRPAVRYPQDVVSKFSQLRNAGEKG
jgi:hypothetical protein